MVELIGWKLGKLTTSFSAGRSNYPWNELEKERPSLLRQNLDKIFVPETLWFNFFGQLMVNCA